MSQTTQGSHFLLGHRSSGYMLSREISGSSARPEPLFYSGPREL